VSYESALQVLALLRGGVPWDVWDGHVDDSDPADKVITAELPYLVHYDTPGYPVGIRLGGSRRRTAQFMINAVGETADQARLVSGRADTLLHSTQLVIEGRTRRVWRTDDDPFIRRDDDWNRPDGGPLFVASQRYALT
jgi:hypothetical protein